MVAILSCCWSDWLKLACDRWWYTDGSPNHPPKSIWEVPVSFQKLLGRHSRLVFCWAFSYESKTLKEWIQLCVYPCKLQTLACLAYWHTYYSTESFSSVQFVALWNGCFSVSVVKSTKTTVPMPSCFFHHPSAEVPSTLIRYHQVESKHCRPLGQNSR